MKVLHVNNASSPFGGTLQCTHSVVCCLPDMEHCIHSFGGPFGDVAETLFNGKVPLRRGNSVVDTMREFEPDLVIWNNTSIERMPSTQHYGAMWVYVAHSGHGGVMQAAKRCHVRLCVSHYLASIIGCPSDWVLHQPVTVPPKMEEFAGESVRTGGKVIRVGRICTPNKRKWELDELVPYYDAIAEVNPDCRFEFVAPLDMHVDIKSRIHGRVDDTCYLPSLKAKGLLHEWDVLLYTSSLAESFGRVVREAQRCGCVPIASNLGGFIEQIQGDAGFLVESADEVIKALAAYANAHDDIRKVCKERGDAAGGLQQWRTEFLERLHKA